MTAIPRTDLDVFPLNLGGNTFGWAPDEDASFAVLDAFVAAGGNLIDTADSYAMWAEGSDGGDSERVREWFETAQRLGRARQGFAEHLLTDDALVVIDALVEIAEARSVEPATVALAWLLAKDTVTAPIASASTVEQLPALVAAPALELTEAEVAALDTASAPFA